jgi:hypothetical protein
MRGSDFVGDIVGMISVLRYGRGSVVDTGSAGNVERGRSFMKGIKFVIYDEKRRYKGVI